LRARAAALEFNTAEQRELKKARNKQKAAEPKEETRGEHAKIKKTTVKPKKSGRPQKHPKPKVGVKPKAAVKAKKPQPRVARAGTSGDKSNRTATSTELKTKIHRLEDELDDLKYPPVELEDELFEE